MSEIQHYAVRDDDNDAGDHGLQRQRCLKRIIRSNRLVEALKMPRILICNPRSVYNKSTQLKKFIKEEEVDVCCLSETWEREDKPLSTVLAMKDYQIISNPFSRRGRGGRPAIIVNTAKYDVHNLTQSTVNIPWTCELVHVLLTPKKVTNNCKMKKLVIKDILLCRNCCLIFILPYTF